LGRRLRRGGTAPAILRHPLLGLGRGAVVDGDLVAALVLEVPCHGIAHHAETEKSHLRHRLLLNALPLVAQMVISGSDCDGTAPASTHVDRGNRPTKVRPEGDGAMALTKEQVLASLAGVAAPDGTPLPRTGTLSEVVANDGKVFFSITVDAGEVQAWESVR